MLKEKYQIVPFAGDNYNAWEFRLKSILQDNGVIGAIEKEDFNVDALDTKKFQCSTQQARHKTGDWRLHGRGRSDWKYNGGRDDSFNDSFESLKPEGRDTDDVNSREKRKKTKPKYLQEFVTDDSDLGGILMASFLSCSNGIVPEKYNDIDPYDDKDRWYKAVFPMSDDDSRGILELCHEMLGTF
ncbi:unnamed protein product [Arctia plantaginis]|uniref:Uncharacterized protein n=1 Tax=Arctia plantaginis TaxID=874455 RepID=A0A8S1B4H6_ARCPL|nr:unnamed protein product [Arctia plantaginis]